MNRAHVVQVRSSVLLSVTKQQPCRLKPLRTTPLLLALLHVVSRTWLPSSLACNFDDPPCGDYWADAAVGGTWESVVAGVGLHGRPHAVPVDV